jgi:hypothetical protein
VKKAPKRVFFASRSDIEPVGTDQELREAVRFLGELIPAQAPRIGSQRLCGRSGQVRSASTFAIALGP